MIVALGRGLEAYIIFKGEVLAFEPEGGEGLFTGSPPRFLKPSGAGSRGPFSWRPLEFEGLRGRVTGYEVLVGGTRVVYAGGAKEPFSVEADVILAPAGGGWYMDAKGFCKTLRMSKFKVAVPIAVWNPGTNLPLEGIEEVRNECRGFNRVRAMGSWKVHFKGGKATVALIEPGRPQLIIKKLLKSGRL
ncbi:hypothetical protein [Ignicoccus hospitalis]|uniref:Uncharacterized protein n=1 Tax=Ignicoccus hospitalis (strain KIN4/I / DSM 18386 / JCM 14125) TaxID=453591 RepID=A8A9S9_IGNH4|nr:hypothetical protein [Ignicoccus hospitalis]ABU81681.1 hypothetical protein Igni_0498 [Ignicoccus hospitalis KIN4/I]HIH89798.1 hypothetical protein [Desulfurococcaceae archaeon]